ncbi:MAG: YCF48-related protein [Planctomycetota bacterium]
MPRPRPALGPLAGLCPVTAACLFATAAASLAQTSTQRQVVGLPSLEEVMSRDAAVRDLAFVDGRHGWAVGDRGLILRTVDGGRRWARVASPVGCPLYSLAMLNHRVGWAAGGYATPYTDHTHAVLLKTEDGGATWRRLPADTLPLLTRVRFFDEQNGAAAGLGAAFAPSGLFETSDGGRTWNVIATDSRHAWSAAAFLAPGAGLLGGDAGGIATFARRGLRHTPLAQAGRRGVRGLAMQPPSSGWLVGDGGLVLRTDDLGQTWRPPPAPLARDAGPACHWRAVATDGPAVWIVGEPGAVALHSPDAGASWRRQPTGVTTPLSAVTFVDAKRGWAAGELGTILATKDGGQTWRVQRRGGERVSVAVLTPRLEDTPLDLITTLAAGEGYRTSVDAVVVAKDATHNESDRLGDSARLREAVTAIGGASSRLHREATATGVPGVGFDRNLVARLRSLRPELVLLTSRVSGSPDADEAWLEQAVRRAVAAAADPASHPELVACGLQPHAVKRVAVASPVDRRSSPRIAAGDFAPLLGTSPAQWVGARRGLLTRHYRPPPAAVGWRVILDDAMAAAAGRDPMAGIGVARGSGGRRPAALPGAGELEALRAVSQKRRHLQQLLAATAEDDAWRSQALNLTSGLDADSGAGLLYQLADGYRQAGRTRMAADTFYLLVRRYTDHPLTDSALAWLIRYYASEEVAYAAATGAATRLETRRPLANVAPARPTTHTAATPPTETGRRALPRRERLERATQLGEYLAQARPALYTDPAVRLPVAAAWRGLGRQREADRAVRTLAAGSAAANWRRAAHAELSEAGNAPPGAELVSRSTSERPLLDGVLDDPVWSEALRLSSPPAPRQEGPGRTRVSIAHDDKFLYLGVACQVLGAETVGPAPGRRRRDADLSAHDRVVFRFDTDRDYVSAFQLAIDRRGWTHDRCWGDQPWDPTWYVAAGEGPGRWVVEAAIPLAALSSQPADAVRRWAVSIVRRSPSAVEQCLTGVGGRTACRDSPGRYTLLRLD